jgi:Family of unknown function (DUF6519)
MPTAKNVGEPCAGEPHARIEAAAGGNWHQSASPHGAGVSRRPYIELGSRRVYLAGCTQNPNGAGVTQQARQLAWTLAQRSTPVRFLIRDRDSKYTRSFDAVFASEGIKMVKTPVRAPKANAIAERFVRTARRECLDPHSDWNEQASIREHLERARFEDLVGASASPLSGGFAVTNDGPALVLTAGRIYVGGFVCELDRDLPLEHFLAEPLTPAVGLTVFVYLDAWERHLTAIDDPEILEGALNGVETTTRLQVAWKIAVSTHAGGVPVDETSALFPRQPSGVMHAAAPYGYRGAENQLYRVEIHDGGALGGATFK